MASSPELPHLGTSLWRPRGVLAVSPLEMRTPLARLGYLVGFPLQYLLLFACIADYFPYIVKSILFAIFLGYHLLVPLGIWTYEARHNPYLFAPGMVGRASGEDEQELLDANRRVVKWYLDEGPLVADLDRRPQGIGFREAPSTPPSTTPLL